MRGGAGRRLHYSTCMGRGGEEQAGRVHELHDEERDDGDGNGDAGLVGGRFVHSKRGVARDKRAPSIHMMRVMIR